MNWIIILKIIEIKTNYIERHEFISIKISWLSYSYDLEIFDYHLETNYLYGNQIIDLK